MTLNVGSVNDEKRYYGEVKISKAAKSGEWVREDGAGITRVLSEGSAVVVYMGLDRLHD